MRILRTFLLAAASGIVATQPFALADTEIVHNTVENYLQRNRAAGNTPNRLIEQSSPYLLQHAYNPVQWHSWGENAFGLAREEGKPIFLSIGYSTCYWCHVMAHESFENEKIAAVLNRHFISIKLDREERPDVDNVYMAATELVNGYGGWPMTVFLNHDLEPFHAGVYYPPFTTDDSTGLYELLLKVNQLWQQDRERIDLVAAQISTAISAAADDAAEGSELSEDVMALGMQQVSASYDEEHGGFGTAPKFPHPGIDQFLLAVAAGDNAHSPSALRMLRDTLDAMSLGGIHDHVGGGFHRYSVDPRWQVPHFEKMLYTQAMMSLAYTGLYALAPEPRYREVVAATLKFVLDEMTHPQGGFYSALDASSERPDQAGEQAEGAYYLWSAAELGKILNKAEWELVKSYFDIQQKGNIESDPRGEFENLNILSTSEAFRECNLGDERRALLSAAKRKLYQRRLSRPRPHLDDKIITAWNGMMIRALVDAARVFDDETYLQAATRAAHFIQTHLLDSDAYTLRRRMRGNEAGIDAGLDDYAWYVNGLLALYRQTNERQWLELALKLTATQMRLFHDAGQGGFYESGVDRNVLFRSRSAYDGALPAANAVAAENLLQLAGVTGKDQWRQMARDTIRSFAASINKRPGSAAWMLSLIDSEALTGDVKP